ncbi:hypothetical protein ACTXG6_28345 [Pseudonocardia sp. Cha107L01]
MTASNSGESWTVGGFPAGALGVSFLIPRPAAAELGSAPDPADTAAAA